MTKEAFVAALGTFFLLGGAFVMIAFVERGVLNYEIAPWSAACVVPVLAGMSIGNRLGHRVDRQRFRTIVVFALFILGLNLLRRAVL